MNKCLRTSALLLATVATAFAGGGCFSWSFSEPTAANPPPVPAAVNTAPTLPNVNVFGEVDGALPKPTPPSGLTSALRQHTFLADGADADVSVSPDGQWLVFTSTRHSTHPKIYLQNVNGVTVTQLTTDDADDAGPVFSPDGKRIAFASNRSGNWSLYMMDLDGKNTVQLTNSRTQDLHPSFSPDGNWLAYSSLGARSGQWELWIIDIASNTRKMVGEGLFPAWSPNKQVSKIAFQKARQRGSRHYAIWTIDIDNGEPRRPTEIAVSPNAALVTPAWSPDGTQLAFASIVDVRTPDGLSTATQHDVWIIDADGRNRRRVTDGIATVLSPTFASTGALYFISNRQGQESIWSVTPPASPALAAQPKPTSPQATVETAPTTP